MERHRNALSPRNEGNREWVPSCFGGFGCEESTGESEYHADMKTTRSAPILILKGLGTMTLGRLGERNNILRDDIVTWKHRIEDSLYIGWITYTTRSSLPDDFLEFAKDTMYLSRAEEKTAFIVIDDIEERSAYEVEYCLMEENGASQTLLQLLKVLENRDFSGALRLVNDFLQDHHARLEEQKATPTLEDTLTTAFAMHNKAVLEMVNGIFKYAVYYFKESADIKEALLGSKHKSVLETLEQLAIAMYGMEAYDQSHATLRCIHARSSSRILATRIWNGIACLHFQKGDYDFAIQCATRATARRDDDEAAPRIALANLGYMQLARGLEEGRLTLNRADEQLSEWLGAHNEIVQSIRYNMNR